MSDRIKLLLVGTGIVVATIVAVIFFRSLGTEKLTATPETTVGPSSFVDESIYERKGSITFRSVEGTDITILSDDGTHSFSISSATVTDSDGNSKDPNDITVGMEIEATVQKGTASVVRILSIPLIAIISPSSDSSLNLEFNITGRSSRVEGDICLTLTNRRTGSVYEDTLSAPIDKEGDFSIPINLSSALDAMAGDALDAKLSICGEDEEAIIAWKYYSGYTSKIKVYFLKNSCSNFHYVDRVIPASSPAARTSIEEILKGPNTKELKMGIFSSANPGEVINDINVRLDTVYINFNPTILNVSRCNVSTLKTQIAKTLAELPSEQEYVITIKGDEDNPLN